MRELEIVFLFLTFPFQPLVRVPKGPHTQPSATLRRWENESMSCEVGTQQQAPRQWGASGGFTWPLSLAWPFPVMSTASSRGRCCPRLIDEEMGVLHGIVQLGPGDA